MLNKLKYNRFLKRVRSSKDIDLGNNINFVGISLIGTQKGGKISIGSNVTLNSMNDGYHINMHSPVKLYADRPNAEIKIGDNTRINGACIHAYDKIHIGQNCLIAANVQIMDGSGHDLSMENPANRINTQGDTKPVIIEDNVWIGANSIILPGVTIGQGSVIAAGSVVVKNIPAMVIAGGNPARIIKEVKKQSAM